MSVIHAPQTHRPAIRHLIPISVIGVSLVILFFRLWYLQVVEADDLRIRAESLHQSSVSRLAPRGMIQDRNGVVLASVEPEIVITAVPSIVMKQPAVLSRLAEMLGAKQEKLLEKVKDSGWRPLLPAAIFVGAPIEVAAQIAEAGDEFPGIGVETQPMRRYANSVDFSHLLGYVWTPSAKDVERAAAEGLTPAAYVGKVGLEYVYEKLLMGKAGEESVDMNAKGKAVRIVGRQNPTPGDRLTLTIDSRLQKLAASMLADSYRSSGAPGAIVAIEPQSGQVLCLASSPTYDTSVFKGGISSADWEKLRDDTSHPLTNRATYGAYAPGSTFKIVTSLAAIKKGIFDPNRTIFCPGFFEVGNRKFKCEGRHGAISFRRAFQHSCNTYFYDLGIRAGAEAIREAAKSCGLGSKSGIDLMGEGRGLIPTIEWLRAVQEVRADQEPRWYTGDTANIAIGQGDVLTTPLQMADVAAMVANRGTIYRPHLLKSSLAYGPKGQVTSTVPEILAQVHAPDSFWTQIQSAMVSVVEEGTARTGTVIPGVRWGGKTGSSQHKKGAKTHSWFVGIAPMDKPQIVVAVLIESAGHGGEIAAPIATRIIKQWLEKGQSEADSKAAASASALSASSESPNSR